MNIKKFAVLPLALAVLVLGSVNGASAQTATPRVALQFATNGLTSPLTANADDATIARLLLDTTGSSEPVRISSLPFNLTVGGGGNASTLNNCQVYNESNPSDSLNEDSPRTMNSGINQITLDDPLVLNANTMTILALRCDVASNLVSGSTYTVNMNTSNVTATGATTGMAAIVTVRGSVVTPPPTTNPPITPGVPSTGPASPLAQNIIMLGASLALATLGFAYLSLRKDSQNNSETADAS